MSNILCDRDRHGLKKRKVTTVSKRAIESLTREAIDPFYDAMEDTIRKLGVGPGRIYNTDETQIRESDGEFVYGDGKRLYREGEKKIGHVTMILTAAASGNILPPAFLFPGATTGNSPLKDGPWKQRSGQLRTASPSFSYRPIRPPSCNLWT